MPILLQGLREWGPQEEHRRAQEQAMELDSGAPQAEMQEEHLPLRAAPPSRSPLNVQHTVERAKASGKALLWQQIFFSTVQKPLAWTDL
jgi:hypothetical protein